MEQWLRSRDYAKADEALLILGTNNLPLLVSRLHYDRQKDFFRRAVDTLHSKLRHASFYGLASRRANRSWEATRVFFRLGTNAAPAIPRLAALVQRGGDPGAQNALNILADLGDDGLTVVASTARSANAALRRPALGFLLRHAESPVAFPAITNALTDPDLIIRAMAQNYFTNSSRPRPPRDGFE